MLETISELQNGRTIAQHNNVVVVDDNEEKSVIQANPTWKHLNDISIDILREIFKFLDFKALDRNRRVSKKFEQAFLSMPTNRGIFSDYVLSRYSHWVNTGSPSFQLRHKLLCKHVPELINVPVVQHNDHALDNWYALNNLFLGLCNQFGKKIKYDDQSVKMLSRLTLSIPRLVPNFNRDVIYPGFTVDIGRFIGFFCIILGINAIMDYIMGMDPVEIMDSPGTRVIYAAIESLFFIAIIQYMDKSASGTSRLKNWRPKLFKDQMDELSILLQYLSLGVGEHDKDSDEHRITLTEEKLADVTPRHRLRYRSRSNFFRDEEITIPTKEQNDVDSMVRHRKQL